MPKLLKDTLADEVHVAVEEMREATRLAGILESDLRAQNPDVDAAALGAGLAARTAGLAFKKLLAVATKLGALTGARVVQDQWDGVVGGTLGRIADALKGRSR